MSTDQWDPTEMVRIRYRVATTVFSDREVEVDLIDHEWSEKKSRSDAERDVAVLWMAPIWNGKPVLSAAIVRWSDA